MSIGLIIFIISIVISLISAINDKNHKKRQQNQPKSPRRQPTTERKPHKGFLEQLGDKFEEMEKQFEAETQPSKRNSSPRQSEHAQTRTQETRQRKTESSSNKRLNQQEKEQELKQALNNTLDSELSDLRSEMDRNKEKQMAILERRAQEIIADKYLSERAKRERLKQLFANKFSQHRGQNNDDLRFNDDEVLNGMIWSEILKKPKQLQ